MAWIEQHREGFRIGWRDEHGKIQHSSNSFISREAAVEAKADIERKTYRKALVHRIDSVSKPLEEIVKEWLESLPVAPITRNSYERSIFPPFLSWFHGRSISTVTRQDLQGYFADRREAIRASTLGKEYSIIKCFFECATEEFLLPNNPMRNVRVPRVRKSPGICLSYDQEARLLKAVTPYQQTKILLARDCGLRATNLGILKRSSIDLYYRTITFNVLKKRVRSTAEAETRTLPLTRRLTSLLQDFENLDPQKLLFTYNGESLKDPDKFLKRLRPKLGFYFRWHDLRHTFYTRLLESCDNYALAEWSLGHAITYWHPTPEKLREAFDKMEARTTAGIEAEELEAMVNPRIRRKAA